MIDCPRETLTRAEVEQGAFRGFMRASNALFSGYKDRNGASREALWQYHIEGACGEIVFCKWRGIYWPADMDFNPGDAGRVGVRTRSRMDYELRLFPSDEDDRPYVLILGNAPTYTLKGWIWGREGKLQKYWGNPTGNDREPAFWVPHSALRPMPGPKRDVVPLNRFPVAV